MHAVVSNEDVDQTFFCEQHDKTADSKNKIDLIVLVLSAAGALIIIIIIIILLILMFIYCRRRRYRSQGM